MHSAEDMSLIQLFKLSNVKINFVIFGSFMLFTTILLFFNNIFQIMATKSIDEMSFAEKLNAVRDAKITPGERNEIYNAWSKDAGYEKVLFNKITFFKQHLSINHYGN